MSGNLGDTARQTLNNLRTPYDEDEIVDLVSDLYELLIKLAYIGRDQVSWASDGGHAINEDLCRELQIEPRVVSLMKRIPYVHEDLRWSIHLFPRSEPLIYLLDEDVERSRDPGGDADAVNRDYILPHDIPLTTPGDEGPYFVLDIRESKIPRVCLISKGEKLMPSQTLFARFPGMMLRVTEIQMAGRSSGLMTRAITATTTLSTRRLFYASS